MRATSPFARFFAIFTRRAAELTEQASAAARAAASNADVERAFGEGAILQRGNVGGFPILKELPNLSAEAQAKATKLLGQEFSPELKSAWKGCENPQAVQEMNSATLEAIRRDNFIKGLDDRNQSLARRTLRGGIRARSLFVDSWPIVQNG